jgi:SAM-dependent methyltransferase
MFGNFINGRDFSDVCRKLPRLKAKVQARLGGGAQQVVAQHWDGAQQQPSFWDVPAVKRRINRLISGDEQVGYQAYFAGKYLAGRHDLVGFSVGCGAGERELVWARTGAFARIEAVDISPASIAKARQASTAQGLDGILSFTVGDALSPASEVRAFDVIFGEGSLHHLSPLAAILRRYHDWLKPGGLFFIHEFVGPTRFQWTARQLEAINGMLALLPARFRTEWRSTTVRPSAVRPSILRMLIGDPSEAIESSRLLPLLRQMFQEVELRPIGGTMIHMLLHGIAHHFTAETPESCKWLDLCFALEDLLLEQGELDSDFVVGIFTKPDAGAVA